MNKYSLREGIFLNSSYTFVYLCILLSLCGLAYVFQIFELLKNLNCKVDKSNLHA